MGVLVFDSGNSIIKAKTANREVVFPHAIQPLTDGEYQKIVSWASINGNSADYIRVNGKPYVVGESAERHGVLVQRSGSARYTRDYYGVLAVAALARLYERGREIAIFGSHKAYIQTGQSTGSSYYDLPDTAYTILSKAGDKYWQAPNGQFMNNMMNAGKQLLIDQAQNTRLGKGLLFKLQMIIQNEYWH